MLLAKPAEEVYVPAMLVVGSAAPGSGSPTPFGHALPVRRGGEGEVPFA